MLAYLERPRLLRWLGEGDLERRLLRWPGEGDLKKKKKKKKNSSEESLQNWVNDLQFLTRILTKFLMDFIDQKRDEKMYKKVWSDISVYNTINREEIRRSRRWYTIPTSLVSCTTDDFS